MTPPRYPVNLVVEGRRCLVVGGGRVALRKVEGLLEAGAVVDVVAPEVIPAIATTAVDAVHRRPYRPGEVAGYRLAIAATDSSAVNRAVLADGEAAGVWVSTVDDGGHGAFTLPAVVRRGLLTVAVSTTGRSPALARWVTRRVADELGPEYEVLLDLVAAERDALKAEGRSTEGLDWQAALDSDMLDLIRTGQVDEARERLKACLSSS